MAAPGELSAEDVETFSSDGLAGTDVLVSGETFVLAQMVGRGKKGVVWRARNALGNDRALKIAMAADYDDKTPQAEMARAGRLERYSFFARLERVERTTFQGVPVVLLVSEWIDGDTLEHVVSKEVRAGADLIRAYVSTMTDVLGALLASGLCHDDMNLGNVMIASPLPGIREPAFTFKVIDLGSLKYRDQHNATKKHGIDDYRWVALHLVALHNAALRRNDISPRERVFLRNLFSIIQGMLDADPINRLADHAQIRELVEGCWRRSRPSAPPTIASPFEYISADQIADDNVLLELFADSLPWLGDVNSSTPQIVTGPRGCGKSTVFRWLSLRTHVSHLNDEARKKRARLPQISGFYISAGVELQSRLSWITRIADAQALRGEIVHLFNLIIAREVIKTLALAEELDVPVEGLTPSDDDASAIRELIELQFLFERVPLFSGVGQLRQVSRELNREIFRSSERIVAGRPLDDAEGRHATASTLPALTELLRTLIPHFTTHPIVFLIDDLSTHRVPAPVQEVLHDVIWLRPSTHTFKISAEKNGVHRSTTAGRTAEIGREFREIDCGAYMLEKSSGGAVQDFAIQLLDRRLQACGYKGSATSLLGRSSWKTLDGESATLAEALRDFATNSKGGQKPAFYHGVDCIADLCSGDVSALLLVFENIFRAGKVRPDTVKAVPVKLQNGAIVTVSQQLVTQLRDFYGVGNEIHIFTEKFGHFVAEMLRNAPPQGKNREPVQIPRIEIDGYAAAREAIRTDPRASPIFDELLRRAVLIDIRPGSARRGHTATMRLHLRRIFLPAFGAALRKNRALTMTPGEFVHALCEPEEAFRTFLRRYNGATIPTLFEGGVTHGVASIDGIPRSAIDAFSTRRAEILEHLDAVGASSAKAAQIATLQTRRAKDQQPDLAAIQTEWRERAVRSGLDIERLDLLLGRLQSRELTDAERSAVVASMLSPSGLTAYSSASTDEPSSAPGAKPTRKARHCRRSSSSARR